MNTYEYINPKDWYDYPFAFLPTYSVGNTTKEERVNYTYMLEGEFGSVFAAEPLGLSSVR